MAKIRIEDIQNILKEDNWKLLSNEYSNLDSELIFECNEGHKVYSTWKKIRNKRECPTCQANHKAWHEMEIISKPKGATRVLALDQATYVTGYSIFDNDKLVTYGTFETKRENETERFAEVKSWLLSMINNWKPDCIGIEGIQFQEEVNQNKISVTVFQTLARLQGILMMICYDASVPCTICPTNSWRKFCGVKGKYRTDKKRSMQLLIKNWYDVSVTEDEADAIGIGKYTADQQKKLKVEVWAD